MTDEENKSAETTIACFRGYADCVQGSKEMEVIYDSGVYKKGKITRTPAMAQAYKIGKSMK